MSEDNTTPPWTTTSEQYESETANFKEGELSHEQYMSVMQTLIELGRYFPEISEDLTIVAQYVASVSQHLKRPNAPKQNDTPL